VKPADIAFPSGSLWDLLAARIWAETRQLPLPALPGSSDLAWQDVAPGISCALLATDTARKRISVLVRLAPGVEYPPHGHAGVEEIHVLQGEARFDGRTLFPGDEYRAGPGACDRRVSSGNGCTCVLITSPDDVLA